MAALESDRLDHVTVSWNEAYSTLVAHSLPVLRVEKSLPAGSIAVIWRNEPSPADQMKANRLLRDVVPTHSW